MRPHGRQVFGGMRGGSYWLLVELLRWWESLGGVWRVFVGVVFAVPGRVSRSVCGVGPRIWFRRVARVG